MLNSCQDIDFVLPKHEQGAGHSEFTHPFSVMLRTRANRLQWLRGMSFFDVKLFINH